MKRLILILSLLAMLIVGCQSISFDEPGYVWEDWDLEQVN